MEGHDNNGFDYNPASGGVASSSSAETLEMREREELPLSNYPSKSKDATWSDKIRNWRSEHSQGLSIIKYLIINAAVIIYFAFATNHFITVTNSEDCKSNCEIGWCDGYGFLLLLMFVVYFGIIYYRVKDMFGTQIYKSACIPIGRVLKSIFKYRISQIIGVLAIVAGFGIFLWIETADDRDRLRSLLGIVVILLVGLLISKHPTKVNWRPVILGVICQVALGVFTIRIEVGRQIFECFGDKVKIFLSYATSGASFVYGVELIERMEVFAFAVLAVIFFFSLMISMLYHLGVMQWVVIKMGWVLSTILNTTVCESVNAAANIFLGQSESPLLIRPYISKLTLSEIHSIMASGFATVAGSVLAAYIRFGADPANLITASVMAAPASLCLSKLIYPETEESQTTSSNIIIEKSPHSSLLDAATNGALEATELVLGIIANLIAFVAFIAFFNGLLHFFGGLVGLEDLSMQLILGKVFIPVAWLIGIRNEDCETVARLIGIKSVINEFVAFEELGVAIKAGLHPRSAAIATFAVCGFANPSSMGILIGSLAAMAPNRRPAITAVAFRAVITGTLVCFMTASIAGLLMGADRLSNISGASDAVIPSLGNDTLPNML